jgi:hypothetical protein
MGTFKAKLLPSSVARAWGLNYLPKFPLRELTMTWASGYPYSGEVLSCRISCKHCISRNKECYEFLHVSRRVSFKWTLGYVLQVYLNPASKRSLKRMNVNRTPSPQQQKERISSFIKTSKWDKSRGKSIFVSSKVTLKLQGSEKTYTW